ncbi:LegC family aminotransferase [candidate division KSB1 bacterium]|nr:LegC family aminotransferase [candidate division KSB1 bacterium]
MIPLSIPSIRGNEWKYVKECLDTEWVSSVGKYVNQFEEDICNYTGGKYAIACMNGTAGLQIAMTLVGIEPGDEVIVPTVTFVAPINTIRYLAANPVFMDCDKYYNIDAEKTIQFISQETVFRDGFTYNKKTKKRIGVIIPVHVFGNPCDFEELIDVCLKRNIKVIEDASESLGSSYSQGKFAGKHTGTIGDIGVYSFNGNKIITTGGGGMIVTDNVEYAEKAKYLTTQAKDDEVRFIHNEVGYNYRMTNVLAAIGVAQLEMLPEYIKLKKSNFQIYKKSIDKISGLTLVETPDYADANYWFYSLQVSKSGYGKDSDQLMEYLIKNEIQIRPLWYLNHLQKPFKKYQSYKIEKAYEMLEKTLNLPCSVNLTKVQIKKVIRLLK